MTDRRLLDTSIRTGENKGIAEAASTGTMSAAQEEVTPPMIR